MELLSLLAPVGYTTGDRWAIGGAWVGILVIAAVLLVISSLRPPRLSR
jgi:hypothetical protein